MSETTDRTSNGTSDLDPYGIRRASLDDLHAIRGLYFDTITTVNTNDYDARQIEVWSAGVNNLARWRTAIEEQIFLLAEHGDRLVGFGSLRLDGYLDFLFTHRDYQRRGVARRLLGRIESVARNLALPKIWARVSMTARPFFAAHEFELTRRFVTMVDDVEFDDALMTKTLRPGRDDFVDIPRSVD